MRLHHRPRRGGAAARGARQRGVLRRGRRRRLGVARPHRRAGPGGGRAGDRAPLAGLRRPAQRRARQRHQRLGPRGRRRRARHARAARGDRGVPRRSRRTGVDICAVPCRDLFMGGRLGPSAKYPKYRLRLFRRGAYRHDEQAGGARGPVGVRAHLGVRGRPRARARGHAAGGDPRRRRRYARLEAEPAERTDPAAARVRGIVVRPAAQVRLPAGGGRRLARRLARPGQDRARLLGGRARVGARLRGDASRRAGAGHYSQERVRGAGRCGCWRSPAASQGAARAARLAAGRARPPAPTWRW